MKFIRSFFSMAIDVPTVNELTQKYPFYSIEQVDSLNCINFQITLCVLNAQCFYRKMWQNHVTMNILLFFFLISKPLKNYPSAELQTVYPNNVIALNYKTFFFFLSLHRNVPFCDSLILQNPAKRLFLMTDIQNNYTF